jgi:hypothetical protein
VKTLPDTILTGPRQRFHDRDGFEIRKGTLAISGGDTWVVGYASRGLTRLDRIRPDGSKEFRIIGRNRHCCIHPTGIPAPLIFR